MPSDTNDGTISARKNAWSTYLENSGTRAVDDAMQENNLASGSNGSSEVQNS